MNVLNNERESQISLLEMLAIVTTGTKVVVEVENRSKTFIKTIERAFDAITLAGKIQKEYVGIAYVREIRVLCGYDTSIYILCQMR